MSTTMSQQTSVTPEHTAERLLEKLWGAPGLCSYCFARRRRHHTEYEEELAEHLTGRNMAALEARGHSVDDDGTLLVNTATSTPEPGTYQEVVPPTEIDGRHYSPRSKTICECGTVDYDPSTDRTKADLFEALENITDRLDEDDIEFSHEAAKQMLRKALTIDKLAGKDGLVLQKALKIGLKHA